LIFSMIGVLGFGQDCGCMEKVRSGFASVELLENPEEYEQDSFYLQVVESEIGNDIYWFYLINNTDAAITLENESTRTGDGNIIIESKDSLGKWNAISYSKADECTINSGMIHIPKNYYASILLNYGKRRNSSFQTESRFKMTFRNETFYTEPFLDTIDYCQFINPIFYVRKGMSKKEIGKYAERILNEDKDCTVERIIKQNYGFSGILTHQANIFYENDYKDAALKLLNVAIENDYHSLSSRSFKVHIQYRQIIEDTTHIENRHLRAYIGMCFMINKNEELIKLYPNKEINDIIKLQSRVDKLIPYLVNKEKLETMDYQDYITIIDGEEYFKINCLNGELTKVRFKEE